MRVHLPHVCWEYTFVLKINSVRPSATNAHDGSTSAPTRRIWIGFQRGKDGEGLVVIDLWEVIPLLDVQQQGSKIVGVHNGQ